MINLRNGGLLLGLLVGALLTALLGVLLLLVLQATRPAPAPLPPPTATLLPPTAPPVAAPTAEPAIPEPTMAPVEEPTTTGDFPFLGFPVPIPTPVPVGYNGQDIGMGFELKSMASGGVAQNTLQVRPGEDIEVAMDYDVWSTLEPIPDGDNTGRCTSTCIVNLTVGMVSNDGSYRPLACIYNGTPGDAPGDQRTWTEVITAPAVPGNYGLRLDYHLMYTCEQALKDISPARPAMTLATFQVTP